jgi:DNA damage-inducible protein 1
MVNLSIFDEKTSQVINISVENDSMTIGQLKQKIQQQTKYAANTITLTYEGDILADSDTLKSKNIKDDEVLLLNVLPTSPLSFGGVGAGNAGAGGWNTMQQAGNIADAFGGFGSLGGYQQQLTNPLATLDLNATPTPQIIQAFRNNAMLMQEIMALNQEFGQAILNNDVALVDQFLHPLREKQKQVQLIMRLNENPFDVEAQKLLEELIQRQNIEENIANALEHNPESFARVFMLYINAEVNGVSLKAFIDSGAQMTIMSKSCAEKCNLMRLMDTRFSGMAKGVGTAKILGRVHLTQMKIGKSWFNLTITVLDQEGMEFLIGLDMLRRWQACIDLKNNVLVIGDERVPFLGEADLPDRERIEQDLAVGSSPLPTTADRLPGPTTSTKPRPSTPLTSSSPASANIQSNPTKSSLSDAQKQQLDILNQFLRTNVQQRQPQQAPQQAQYNENSIKQLVEMGFERIEAIQALEVCRGNVDLAANLLIQKKFGNF